MSSCNLNVPALLIRMQPCDNMVTLLQQPCNDIAKYLQGCSAISQDNNVINIHLMAHYVITR